MIPNTDERQIAIKFNDNLISNLDCAAKAGEMNRNHLMLSLVNIWLNVLMNNSGLRSLFYITCILRTRKKQMECKPAFEHEFTESRLPEKPLPLKFSDSTIFDIDSLACVNQISRHQLLKTMIIVGVEELRELTEGKTYQFGAVEKKLHKSFSTIMEKGFKAFKAYIN
ncbi:MAG: hypothetical protein PHN84_07925 [Desulfuromonadaceae bacterium]|nr:hypothetical protein [Desulfuromonadaceae bacterium]MDD2854760.1 hypothetical protein [Desulfuromonadaceae bacterium]